MRTPSIKRRPSCYHDPHETPLPASVPPAGRRFGLCPEGPVMEASQPAGTTTQAVDADVKMPQSADFLSPSAMTLNSLLGAS